MSSLTNTKSFVRVIAPLVSLMEDQVLFVKYMYVEITAVTPTTRVLLHSLSHNGNDMSCDECLANSIPEKSECLPSAILRVKHHHKPLSARLNSFRYSIFV